MSLRSFGLLDKFVMKSSGTKLRSIIILAKICIYRDVITCCKLLCGIPFTVLNSVNVQSIYGNGITLIIRKSHIAVRGICNINYDTGNQVLLLVGILCDCFFYCKRRK